MGTVVPFYGGQQYYPVEPVGPYKPPPAVTSPPPGGGDGTTPTQPPPYTPPPFTNGPPDTIPELPPTDPGRGTRPGVPNDSFTPPPYRSNPPGRQDYIPENPPPSNRGGARGAPVVPNPNVTPPPYRQNPGRQDYFEQPVQRQGTSSRAAVQPLNPETVRAQALARMQAIQNYQSNLGASTPLGAVQTGYQPGAVPNLDAVDALRHVARKWL